MIPRLSMARRVNTVMDSFPHRRRRNEIVGKAAEIAESESGELELSLLLIFSFYFSFPFNCTLITFYGDEVVERVGRSVVLVLGEKSRSHIESAFMASNHQPGAVRALREF